jgi:hypothetical protein
MHLYLVLSSGPNGSPSRAIIFSEDDRGVGQPLQSVIQTRARTS